MLLRSPFVVVVVVMIGQHVAIQTSDLGGGGTFASDFLAYFACGFIKEAWETGANGNPAGSG